MFQRALRWRVAVGCSLCLAAVGIVLVEPVLLVGAMAPMAFVAYSALTSAPSLDDALEITRTVSPTHTAPGGTVRVRLTVENTGTQSLPKLRLVDGVPAELSVVEGSPRAALSLRRGESTTLEYSLRTRYGEFAFEPVTARTQSLSAGGLYTTTVSPTGDASVSARLDPSSYPPEAETAGTTGDSMIDRANDGLEFFGIRTYQPTDPLHRINWRGYAKNRQLTTIDYRDREVSDILVVVDAREPSGVARTPTSPTGTELCVYVANELVSSLRTYQVPTGIATLGVDESGVEWVVPGTDRQNLAAIRTLLDAAAATVQPGEERPASDVSDERLLDLLQQIRSGTHVVFISPFHDERAVDIVRQFRSTGYSVSACSPAVASRETTGGQVVKARRLANLASLHSLGVRTVDWQPTDPLDESLSQALRLTATATRGR